MNTLRKQLRSALWGGAVCLLLVFGSGCRAPQSGLLPPDAPTTAPTATQVVLPTATATPRPALPTATPPPTLTPATVSTARPSATPTIAPTPQVDRSCPAEPPSPVYASYVLSETAWPTGDETLGERPQLLPPLSTAEETRINWGFPYGSDGSGRYRLHNGLDMTQWPGAPVLAVADGMVVVAGSDVAERYGWRCDWYGQLVVLELDERWNDQPLFALYGHVRGLLVEPGQRVTAGEPLAEIGAGGAATVPHLHLEIRLGRNEYDATRNPVLWLGPDEATGIIAGRLLDPDGRAWEGVRMTLIDVTGEADFLTTWTYLDDVQHLITPDEQWAENFVFGAVPPGEYDLFTVIEGVEYRERVSVVAGQITGVEVRTNVPATATP